MKEVRLIKRSRCEYGGKSTPDTQNIQKRKVGIVSEQT